MGTNLNILALKDWLNCDKHPVVIAGPCSAESENQVLSTARELAKTPNVKIFRAGIWKPRTRPNTFEGVGSRGLEWLKSVKQETGLLTTVEVANPQHVEECLKANIDIIWIGARTVVNPFSVQEITEVLKGVDIPVMVKNPVSPDLKLWLGALERVNQVGINKLIAIHRGFYTSSKTLFRNEPNWEIPIELKRSIPELPIFVDPSHICGTTKLLLHISQKAIDLEMNGLMIETHIDPDHALTDQQQQITPAELANLINKLVIRKETGNEAFEDLLSKLRMEIDKIDDDFISQLGRRMEIVAQIGEYKKSNNITILQLKRWSQIFNDRMNKGLDHELKREFLTELLELIHEESIKIQTDIMNKD